MSESGKRNRNTYLIGDLAGLTGLSKHSINFYLRIGLLKEVGRSQSTSYRYFNDDTLDRLKQIISLRRMRYTIREIKEILGE